MATHFGIEGTPAAKGSIEYDSGWINITDKQGQNITIVNGLNLNMNDANLAFDITGKTSLDDQKIQRHLSLTCSEQWNKPYGGTGLDEAGALVQTADGGYALAGWSNSDFWLIKTDSESGLGWVDSDANSITLHRGLTDIYWNYVRVRVWKPQETP